MYRLTIQMYVMYFTFPIEDTGINVFSFKTNNKLIYTYILLLLFFNLNTSIHKIHEREGERE
jgi:hypothetical protein